MSNTVVDLAAAAAASAAEAQAKLELLAQPIKRKRKEPSITTTTASSSSSSSTPNNDNTGVAIPSPSPSSSSTIPYEHSLQLVNPAIQSLVQDEVLAIFFPTTKQHGQHLYRQLPGPQPFSIVRKDLNTLANNEYWACEKSDGERAMLYVSHSRKATYLLDRKFLVKQLKHPMYAELWGSHGHSLIDGELVTHEGVNSVGPQATFMIFDLILLNGDRIMEKRLSERLSSIGTGIVVPYRQRFPQYAAYPPFAPTPSLTASSVDGSDHPIAIRAKAFHRKHHLKDGIIDHIKPHGNGEYMYDDGKRRNKNDGVIFTPENDDYMCKNVQLLKWKWPGLNTIDFLCRHPWFDHDGKLMLYSTANQMPRDSDNQKGSTVTVHVRSVLLTPAKRDWFMREVAGKSTAIVEMQYDAKTSSWSPKLFRWDKSAPNFMTTVIGTLETVIDNVMPNDLFAVCNRKGQTSNAPPPSQSSHNNRPITTNSSSSAPSSSSSSSSQSNLWSSGNTKDRPQSSAQVNGNNPSSRLQPPPSFTFDPASIVSSSTSKSMTVFEEIASTDEKPLVPHSRLFGD